MWEDRLALYDQIIAKTPEVERKGKGMPYTSANGHMFSQLNKSGEIGFRFSKDDAEQFMNEYKTTVFKSYGAVMKGYVLIPESMLEDINLASVYLRKSYEYVLTLEPK